MSPLIIDARHRLRWHQRLFSDASTAMMWGIWLWLWSPMLRSFGWLAHMGARSYPPAAKLLGSGPSMDLDHYVMALVGTSGTLLAWNWLPASRVELADARSLTDYARHFELAEHEILAGRRASVCVVHHDDRGRIVRLECRTADDAEALVAEALVAEALVADAHVAEAHVEHARAEAQVAA
jgi:poly-beta-1,6-N-acetyl-D-glucosamine biosynthesis protein PgaD